LRERIGNKVQIVNPKLSDCVYTVGKDVDITASLGHGEGFALTCLSKRQSRFDPKDEDERKEKEES
jgi:hypothetical protein